MKIKYKNPPLPTLRLYQEFEWAIVMHEGEVVALFCCKGDALAFMKHQGDDTSYKMVEVEVTDK